MSVYMREGSRERGYYGDDDAESGIESIEGKI
jgi:hypothetical protein